MKQKYAIIGGGISGLALGYLLSKKGYGVTVYDDNPGGVAASYNDGFYLEMFYHHFFLNDRDLQEMMRELKLSNTIIKKETKTGFYVNGKMHPFATPMDILMFSPLRPHDRVKLGLMSQYLRMMPNHMAKKMEGISLKDWCRKHHSKAVYQAVWEPLLKTKFGKHSDRIPAAWLWGRLNSRLNSRKGHKEVLCYPKGSFKILFDALIRGIKRNRGQLIQKKVTSVVATAKGVSHIIVGGKRKEYDKYVLAVPNPALPKIVQGMPSQYKSKLERITYMANICVKIFLKKSLSKYYWINISDPHISFGGLIEHTNLAPREHYNGMSVCYAYQYLPAGDELAKMPDSEIFLKYLASLQRMFPPLKKSDIIRYRVDRTMYASPVYDLGYETKKPSFRTFCPNLYLLNTSQIYPEDRNLSHGIKYAKKLLQEINA